VEAHDGQTDGRNGRCHSNEVTRCKAARDPYATCQISSWSNNRRRSYGDFLPTTQLAAATLTSDPLTLKLVHGVLVSKGPFLPSLVFVGLFVFPLGGGTGQTDGQDQHMMGPPFKKDGPIIRTDSSHAGVRKLASIGIFIFFTITLSNMVRLLQNFVRIVSQTTWTNAAILVIVWLLLSHMCIYCC